jgi:hypothetical protein
MKKNLKLLTGIAFLIAFLVAGGCGNDKKQKDNPTEDKNLTTEGTDSEAVADDSTTVRVYLKDMVIDGIMHLEMYDSRKDACPVMDNLVTVVNPGDTVIFYKAKNSKVKAVPDIRLLKTGFTIPSEGFKPDSGLYVLIINPLAPDSSIVKYQIDFKLNKDTTYTIDPYLKIPKQQSE